MLRHWRHRRRMSQLQLASDAEVSTRHLSCVETGKARPSREMVLVLASALEVPLRERNTLLKAAGHSAAYRQTDLADPEMDQVRAALTFLLAQQEPYGAAVVDRLWNPLMMNDPMRMIGTWLFGGSRPHTGDHAPNLLVQLFSDDGFRPFLTNWKAVARSTLDRVYRDAMAEGDEELLVLHEQLCAMPGVPSDWRRPDLTSAPPILIPVELHKDGIELSLFTTITTLGTPMDVTLSELRIESYFPADAQTDVAIRQLAAALGGAAA